MEFSETKHSAATRLVHAGLGITIVANLILSLVMEGPRRGQAGDFLFTIHKYVGVIAFVAALAFWVVLLKRRHGTHKGALFPWFSSQRRADLWADFKAHLIDIRHLRIPNYKPQSPFVSAVHGLGLLLMSAMAATGTVYFAAPYFNLQKSSLIGLDLDIHRTLANLAWAYLIGHVSLAVLHHFRGEMRVGTMWSLSPKTNHEGK